MDNLPPHLLLEILSRLADSVDLARCRVASKSLNSLSPEIRSVHLHCSYHRYAKSRSPLTRSSITPFKAVFCKLINELPIVETVSIGVERPLGLVTYDEVEDEEDDLFLSDVRFLNQWLPKVCGQLRSFSVSDFWVQACWRRSDVLSLISSCCVSLLELEIRNAWLSVDGLTPMANLTTLTLEYVRLDEENLEKVNDCFHSLQVLNLIGVGGLKDPKLHLVHLKTCHWTLSNAPDSITICCPSLVNLKLTCVKPDLLVIEAPLLYDLHLSLASAGKFKVNEFSDLRKLHLESTWMCSLLKTLPFGTTVKSLTVVSSRWDMPVAVTMSYLELLSSVFPNLSSLTLTSGAWSELETYSGLGGCESRTLLKVLKCMTAYLTVNDVEVTLSTIFCLLDNCSGVSFMALFIHRDVVSNVTSSIISRCMARCARVRWKWGLWKEGTKDAWISDGI